MSADPRPGDAPSAPGTRRRVLALLVIALLVLPLALTGRPFELRLLTVVFLLLAVRRIRRLRLTGIGE